MGIWGTIFGSDKVIEKTTDGVYNGIDMAFYTDEEKAIAMQKKQEFYIKILKAYEPFKVAQRFLALIYSIPYVSIIVYGVVMKDAVLVNSINDALGLQTIIILGFYFGGGAFEGVVKAKVETFSKKEDS